MYPESGPSRSQSSYGSNQRFPPTKYAAEMPGDIGRDDRVTNGYARDVDPNRAGPSASPYTRGPVQSSPWHTKRRNYPGSPPPGDRYRGDFDRERSGEPGRSWEHQNRGPDRGLQAGRDLRDTLGLDTSFRSQNDMNPDRRDLSNGSNSTILRDWSDRQRRFGATDERDGPNRGRQLDDYRDLCVQSKTLRHEPRADVNSSRRSSPTKSAYRNGGLSPIKPPRPGPHHSSSWSNHVRAGSESFSHPEAAPLSRSQASGSRDSETYANDTKRPESNQPGPSSARTSPGITTPPKAPRSLRGSSSPVESRHARQPQQDPKISHSQGSPVKVESVPQGLEEGEDLEEGEVISPVRIPKDVKPSIDSVLGSNRNREPWARERDMRDQARIFGRDREGDLDRDRAVNRINDRERDRDPTRFRDREWDWERDRERERARERDRPAYDRAPPPGPGPSRDPRRWNNRSPVRRGRSPIFGTPTGRVQQQVSDNGWASRRRASAGQSAPPEGLRQRDDFRRVSDQGPNADTSFDSAMTGMDEEKQDDVEAPQDRANAGVDSVVGREVDEDDQDRPLTPPLPPPPFLAGDETTPMPQSEPQPSYLAAAKVEIDRPDTPALPAELKPLRDAQAADMSMRSDASNPLDGAPQEGSDRLTANVHISIPTQDSPIPHTGPEISVQTVSSPPGRHGKVEHTTILNSPAPSQPSLIPASASSEASSVPPTNEPFNTLASSRTSSDVLLKKPNSLDTATHHDPTSATAAPHSTLPSRNPEPLPPTPKQTLAERRSVHLPPTQGPLSSPFGERVPRRDPAPTADSVQESTDTEPWPRTVDLDDQVGDGDGSDEEDGVENKLISVIKKAQRASTGLDMDSILAWNVATAPEESSRVPRDLSPRSREKRLRELTLPMDRHQREIAHLVALRVSQEELKAQERIELLQQEYKLWDDEWQEHCQFLDNMMEKRGPPPESLYALPNAIPVVTPGPAAPMTPVTEDMISARAMRRRGAGDAVTTEAEFQEILAAMADTAAKDPNYRASKTTAVVPDMLPPEERRLRYQDENDLVEDPIAFYDFKGNAEPVWTDEERQIFVRRYLNFPKQFGKISEALPNKSASDCVLYYYRTKKEVDYKSMLASRRGVTRKKAMPLKKGGKSAALLANLDQKKPTVDSAPVRTVATPARQRDTGDGNAPSGSTARRGKARLEPGSLARRRIIEVQQGEDSLDTSEATSRDGSEAPAAGSKNKMRLSVKGAKRPRRSSVPPGSIPAESPRQVHADGSLPPGINGIVDLAAAQADLLPPIKKPRKTRKNAVLNSSTGGEGEIGPDGTPFPASGQPGGSGDKPSRRGTTSSYWSIDEKKRMKSLVEVHRLDFEAIAAALANKTWKQVKNFVAAHAEEFGIEIGNDLVTSRPLAPHQKEGYFKPSVEAGFSRSIYDVYNTGQAQPYPNPHAEPRLGVFPSINRQGSISGPIAAPAVSASPVQHVSRPGGMRISALLNDEPTVERDVKRDIPVDAQSDGTVEEDGVRPSPRGLPPIPFARRSSAEYRHERSERDWDQRDEREHGYAREQEYARERGSVDTERYREGPARTAYLYQPNPIPASTAWNRRAEESYYSTPVPRAHTAAPGSHLHYSSRPVQLATWDATPTSQHPHPSPQQPSQSQQTMGYYSRPEPYRARTTPVVDTYRSTVPSQHPHPPPLAASHPQQQAGRHVSRETPASAASNGAGRFERQQPDWRGYSPVSSPAPAAPAVGQVQNSQPHRYNSPGPHYATLPPIQQLYDGNGESRR